MFSIPLKPDDTFFVHSDPRVDLAVIPIGLDSKTLDFRAIGVDLIVDHAKFQELGITEGTDVFFAGLFVPFAGAHHLYPVMRFGRMALVSDEKIPWSGKEETELYLAELNSFPGNSGAPVFVSTHGNVPRNTVVVGAPGIYLLGVMLGYFKNWPVTVESTGIAGILPAERILELLDSPALKSSRTKDE